MNIYSKHGDVNAVLNRAEVLIYKIEGMYQKSLHQQNIPDDLLLDVRECLGNLRSALDFTTHKITGKNYPIRNSKKDFEEATKNLLETAKTVLEKWQPYNSNEWIGWFNLLSNKYKHVTLIPQKRTEEQQVRVSHPQGGSISWNPNGVRFSGNVQVFGTPIDPHTQMPVPNSAVKTEKITWVNFQFDNSLCPGVPDAIPVLEFLKQSFVKVKKIITELESTSHPN